MGGEHMVRKKERKIHDNKHTSVSGKKITVELKDNQETFRKIFSDCDDVKFENFQFGPRFKIHTMMIYCDSLVQKNNENYIKSVILDLVPQDLPQSEDITLSKIKSYYENNGITSKSVSVFSEMKEAVTAVLNGTILVVIDGWDKVIGIAANSVEKRPVQEPQNEVVVHGPREGTTESLTTNLGLIRSRLKSTEFKINKKSTGKQTNQDLAFCYVDGAVDPNTLQEFLNRIETIKDEEILDTSYIAELLEDSTYSPFPQYRITERPDIAVASLLDGKIIVLVEGSGSILICPGLFNEFFQSPADYYERTLFSSFIRLTRIIAYMISLILPSLYIALSTFHVELIPTVLLIAILDTREGIPYPALIEGIILIFFFELLQEAGVRLPRPIGSTVSIVGALIIGEAAINAGIASPIMVVVIALTGIASFSIPQYDFGTSSRILRVPLMILAAMLGGFGLMIGLLLIYLHLSTIRTLGQPYLGTFGPIKKGVIRDSFLRAPLKRLLRSPRNRNLHKSTNR